MENRISFIIVISLVCISVLITFWFTDRFLGEEYSPVNALPPLPQIPKESVEMAFLYSPEVFRDPFKSPVLAKPKLVITPKTETTKTEITFPNVVTKTEVTTTGIVQKAEKPVVHPVKTPTLPKFKITGIIYDETPLVIIEFNGKSSILEKGNEIIRGLKIKRIYIDSIDVSWEGKDYNIKLGGN
jgi:hypothetical protein